MYYELFAIARITDPLKTSKEAVKIASTVGKMILNNRGVIRDITSLGPRALPKIMTKEQEKYFQGYHFLMSFDVSLSVQQHLLRTLRNDPRILRANIMKHDMRSKLNVGNSFKQAAEALNKTS